MICPACKSHTLIVEYSNIELDYCPACRGVWFDSGELEMLLECAGMENCRSYLGDVAGAPAVVTSEKERKCPICRKKMKKVYIDQDKKIMVDICQRGHGIWFDGGEVVQLLKELAEKSPGQHPSQGILNFIGEIFKYQVQK
jgi:Zn-finger nucleic acid-binding protein